MVGVGMVVAYNLQTSRPRVLLHLQLVPRIDEKPVPLGFLRRIFQGKDFLRNGPVYAQVAQRDDLDDVLRPIPRASEKDPTALVGIVAHTMLTDLREQVGTEIERHRIRLKKEGRRAALPDPALHVVPDGDKDPPSDLLSDLQTCDHRRPGRNADEQALLTRQSYRHCVGVLG
jgi:hypothetical protein